MPRIKVFVSDAVLEKNYGLMTMDPYCVLVLGGAEVQTKVATGGAAIAMLRARHGMQAASCRRGSRSSNGVLPASMRRAHGAQGRAAAGHHAAD